MKYTILKILTKFDIKIHDFVFFVHIKHGYTRTTYFLIWRKLTTNKVIDKIITSWFKYAKDRKGGREKRRTVATVDGENIQDLLSDALERSASPVSTMCDDDVESI